MQRIHDGPTSRLSHALPVIGRMPANLGLNRIEFPNARQHMPGQRRLGRLIELEERPSHMRPAERQFDRVIAAIPSQPLKPGVAVHLQHTAERCQVCRRMRAFTILGIHISGRRVRRAGPWSVIHRIAPQSPGFGPAAARIQHR
jgi:hypothetical protein